MMTTKPILQMCLYVTFQRQWGHLHTV